MRIDLDTTFKVGRHSGLIAGLLGKAKSGESFASALEQVADAPLQVQRSLTQPVISPTLAARSSFVQVDAQAAMAWQVRQHHSLPPIDPPVAQSVQPVANRTAVTGSLAVELSEVPSTLSPTGRVTIALSRPLPDMPIRDIQKAAGVQEKPRRAMPNADDFIEAVDVPQDVTETVTPVEAGTDTATDHQAGAGTQRQTSDHQQGQPTPGNRPAWLARVGHAVEAAVGRLVQAVRSPGLPAPAPTDASAGLLPAAPESSQPTIVANPGMATPPPPVTAPVTPAPVTEAGMEPVTPSPAKGAGPAADDAGGKAVAEGAATTQAESTPELTLVSPAITDNTPVTGEPGPSSQVVDSAETPINGGATQASLPTGADAPALDPVDVPVVAQTEEPPSAAGAPSALSPDATAGEDTAAGQVATVAASPVSAGTQAPVSQAPKATVAVQSGLDMGEAVTGEPLPIDETVAAPEASYIGPSAQPQTAPVADAGPTPSAAPLVDAVPVQPDADQHPDVVTGFTPPLSDGADSMVPVATPAGDAAVTSQAGANPGPAPGAIAVPPDAVAETPVAPHPIVPPAPPVAESDAAVAHAGHVATAGEPSAPAIVTVPTVAAAIPSSAAESSSEPGHQPAPTASGEQAEPLPPTAPAGTLPGPVGDAEPAQSVGSPAVSDPNLPQAAEKMVLPASPVALGSNAQTEAPGDEWVDPAIADQIQVAPVLVSDLEMPVDAIPVPGQPTPVAQAPVADAVSPIPQAPIQPIVSDSAHPPLAHGTPDVPVRQVIGQMVSPPPATADVPSVDTVVTPSGTSQAQAPIDALEAPQPDGHQPDPVVNAAGRPAPTQFNGFDKPVGAMATASVSGPVAPESDTTEVDFEGEADTALTTEPFGDVPLVVPSAPVRQAPTTGPVIATPAPASELDAVPPVPGAAAPEVELALSAPIGPEVVAPGLAQIAQVAMPRSVAPHAPEAQVAPRIDDVSVQGVAQADSDGSSDGHSGEGQARPQVVVASATDALSATPSPDVPAAANPVAADLADGDPTMAAPAARSVTAPAAPAPVMPEFATVQPAAEAPVQETATPVEQTDESAAPMVQPAAMSQPITVADEGVAPAVPVEAAFIPAAAPTTDAVSPQPVASMPAIRPDQLADGVVLPVEADAAAPVVVAGPGVPAVNVTGSPEAPSEPVVVKAVQPSDDLADSVKADAAPPVVVAGPGVPAINVTGSPEAPSEPVVTTVAQPADDLSSSVKVDAAPAVVSAPPKNLTEPVVVTAAQPADDLSGSVKVDAAPPVVPSERPVSMPAQPPVVAAHADRVPVVEAAPTLPPQAAVTPAQTVEGPDVAAAPALSEPETDGNADSPAPVPPKASGPEVGQTVENPAALAVAPAPASPDGVAPPVFPAPAVSMNAGPAVLPVAEEAPVVGPSPVPDTVDVETAVSSAAVPPMVSAAPDGVAAQPVLAAPVAPRVTAAIAAEASADEMPRSPLPETADIPMPAMPTAVDVGAPVVKPQPGTVTPAPVAAPVAAAHGPEVMAPAAETVVPPFVPAAVLPEVPTFAAVGAVIVEGEPADVPAVWQPVVMPAVAVATAVAGMAVPRQSAMVVWPEAADAIPPLPVENDRRPAGETPVLPAPSRPQVFVDAPISPAWPEAVEVAAAPSRSPIVASAPASEPLAAAHPKADTAIAGNASRSDAPAQEVRPVTAPAQPVMQPTGSRPVAKQEAGQAVTPEPSAPLAPRGKQPLARVIDAPVAPWPAALSLDSVVPTMAAPVKRDAEAPARPVLAGVPAATVAPAEAVRGDVQTEVITSDIENATSGRMMVGAWQTYQQTPAVPASVRETGTMVPPLPVRLLNLALNLTSAGRRLDAPLLDGAVVAQPGLTTFNAVAVPVAPTADRSPIQSSPAADVTMPMDAAPTLPQTTGDVGGTVPQSPIDPVAAKPQRRTPVGIPTDPPVPVAVGDAFDAMVTDEASDLDILADWPEEEAIDGDLWPDEVPPEAAAEFLMALGNVVAGQSGQAATAGPAMPDAAEAAPHSERRPAAATPLSERRPAPLPGPLPLHDHMANVQANTLMSGTPTEQPDAPAPATATTDAAPSSTGTGREGRAPAPTAAPTAAGQAPIPAAAPMAPAAGPVPPNAPIVDTTAPAPAGPTPARPDVRRPAPARRAPEPVRVRSEANEGALPIGLIPKAMVQPATVEAPVTEPVLASGSPLPEATSGGSADHDGDAPPDQRQQTDAGVMPQAESSPSFVNPMAFTPRPEMSAEAGASVETLTVDAGTRRTTMAAPTGDADPIGPITVRTAEAAASKAPEAIAKMAEPVPPVTTAGMSAQQLIAAVNDGVPVHFAQFPNLVQGIVASKPFVDKTVDVVLQPENLGRIRLEVSLVEGGTAIRVAIATQTAAAQQVFESYGSRMQQIVQSQGYALKEFEVKVSDRPIRSEGRGQSGNDAAGQRQNRRRRGRGSQDDATI